MSYSFHPEAEAEFDRAIEYYEEREAGLGYDFVIEVYSAIELAVTYPKAWTIIEGDLRRCLVHRFPYGILYAEEGEDLFIVAVMNLHKDPDYWKHRIG